MGDLIEQSGHCPYCGSGQLFLVDPSVSEQRYIEDCQRCCQPILVRVRLDAEGQSCIEFELEQENG
ncbi:CPXCG motif-containing cysteine-rich protein [Motiliproteus coralliicola]|uniref:CPXCG motif-containing cysteine-rich protein n=1 Tax=Motiliproteus coralliicola TaxID=2283196 RepID=A0A369WSM4_9GAMM|nr:CPXCG motif-containing cysteine-rich protein [Motiliproteus coralliicola]RDE25098.1 CPXCG motif-containing cysteine-rich protein [Motiliproteus coralliicola]